MLEQVKDININAFDYPLPAERIAKFPLSNREDAKLLHYKSGKIDSHYYRELTQLLSTEDHLVFNQTKVVQARLFFPLNENRNIEIFCLESWEAMPVQEAMQTTATIDYKCMIGGAKKWKSGALEIAYNGRVLKAEKLEAIDGIFKVRFSWGGEVHFAEILDRMGKTPLPPYLKRAAEESDKERYQTVFAQTEGSVAAPTAGLHFTERLLDELHQKGVTQSKLTLHVGAGTFKPVSENALGAHDMHAEEFLVEKHFLEGLLALSSTKRIVCVGTTSMRALESMYWLGCMLLSDSQQSLDDLLVPQWVAYDASMEQPGYKKAIKALLDILEKNQLQFIRARTQIIIAPGYTFKMVKALLTNFHQPRSTLLLLVAAIAGEDWKKIYQYALDNDYRFLSFGDGSLLRINA